MSNIDEGDKFAIMAEGVWIQLQSEAGKNRTLNVWLPRLSPFQIGEDP
jgi:hypothetical protein